MRSNIPGIICFLGVVIGGMIYAQAQWIEVTSGTNVNLYGVYFFNPDSGFVVGAQGVVLKTTNGGTNWQDVSPATLTNDWNDLYFWNMDSGLVVGSGGVIARTVDGGQNWTTISSGVGDNLLAVSFSGNVGIIGGSSQTILRSTDAGMSWDIIQTGYFGGAFQGVYIFQSSLAYVAGDNAIFQALFGRSMDGGVNWDFYNFYLNNNEGKLTDVRFLTLASGFCTARVWDGSGGISHTNDGGVNWTTQLFSNALYALAFPTNSVGYAVGNSGIILRSTDGGATWLNEVSGSAENLRDVAFADTAIGYAVGLNGTILKRTQPGDTTAIPTPVKRIAGGVFLWQNYPNPFNPETVIRYQQSTVSDVELVVYNLLGEKVKTLVNRRQSPGFYTVRWNGRDDAGHPLPGGIYLYRLKVNNRYIMTRKMVLLR